MKRCWVCKTKKASIDFSPYNWRTGDYKCRKCASQLNKRYASYRKKYAKTPKAIATRKCCVKRRAIRRAQLISALKSKPCADCFGWFHPCQMQFDHRDRAEKKFILSKSHGKGLKQLIEEVKKCDVVCANCHSLRTFKGRDWLPLRKALKSDARPLPVDSSAGSLAA